MSSTAAPRLLGEREEWARHFWLVDYVKRRMAEAAAMLSDTVLV
jgi:hypothetical protein